MNLLRKHNSDQNVRNRLMTKAQGLAEFALILPVLLIVLFIMIELARVLHAWLAVENGARQGVRFAVTMEYDPAKCAHPPQADGTCAEADILEARLASIHDATWVGSASIVRVKEEDANSNDPSYFHVVVCDPDGLVDPPDTSSATSCLPKENPGDPGEQVVVVVEFNHPVILPIISSIAPKIRLTAKREARIETFRVPLPADERPKLPTTTPKPTITKAPTATAGNPLPVFCDANGNPKSYSMMHRHSVQIINGGRGIFFVFHAIPNTYSKPQLIIQSVWVRQDYNPITLEVETITYSNPSGSCSCTASNPSCCTILHPWEREDYVERDINRSVFDCTPLCTCSSNSYYYNGGIDVVFDEPMSEGTYTLGVKLYIPDTNEICYLDGEVDFRPPGPTDTEGPSPTAEDTEEEEPTETPTATATATKSGEGPVEPPD